MNENMAHPCMVHNIIVGALNINAYDDVYMCMTCNDAPNTIIRKYTCTATPQMQPSYSWVNLVTATERG